MDRFAALIEARRAVTETNRAFAGRLGIDPGDWWRIRHGVRRVPRGLAARAIALWPDLEAAYLAIVADDLRAHAEISATASARCADAMKAS